MARSQHATHAGPVESACILTWSAHGEKKKRKKDSTAIEFWIKEKDGDSKK